MRILKYCILLLLIPCTAFAAARPNSQKGIYFVQCLTGGTQGCLDSFDQTGDGNTDIGDGTPNQYDLIDGDCAIYGAISGTSVYSDIYVYDADGTDDEFSPDVIRPDDFATQGVWRLVRNRRLTEGITQQTFGAADTTPDVSNGGASLVRYWATGGAVTITDFDDGDDHSEFTDGDWFKLEADHAATLDCSSNANLWCNGGNDYTLTVGEVLTVSYVGTQWIAEITNGPGQIDAIADPDADRIYFWDESSGTSGAPGILAPDGTYIEINGTTLQLTSATTTKINRYHQCAYVDPNVVYDSHSGVIVLDPYTAAAITVTSIRTYLNEAPTTELTITGYQKAAAIGYSGGTVIGSGDTASGVGAITSGWTDNTIPSASKVWILIGDDPDSTTTELEICLDGTYD